MNLRDIILPSFFYNATTSTTTSTTISSPTTFLSFLVAFSCHGNNTTTTLQWRSHANLMFLFFLLLFQISSFLLCKLFNSLYSKRLLLLSQRDFVEKNECEDGYISCGSISVEVIGEEDHVFFSDFSEYDSPLDDLADCDALSTSSACPSPIISSSDNAAFDVEEVFNGEEANSDEKKYIIIEAHKEKKQQNYGESLNGEYSTSKSSIEWRGSAILRDSETDYPFSSSSRRSSSRWESYTMFRKYDEEMLFFDRISEQKLNETEYLRTFKVKRTISQRIVHKLTPMRKHLPEGSIRDPYEELESAYVSQICLTWEALNWNYSYFQRSINVNQCMKNSGCPARVAQQFQQFEVLLHRFIENEPFEHGRRPEVYARMRICSPKLLQVPEFKDLEGDERKEEVSSRVSYAEFLVILEDCIKTFMSFLEADKETPCEMFRAFINKKTISVDQNHLFLIKRAHRKKKMRIKELERSRKCFKKRKPKYPQGMEALMVLIDLKVVSRVLRMAGISEEQLHWCEEKLNKVEVLDGKVQRDSSPLFFPVH
ncbi:Ribosomal protein L34Ae protein [Dioscorea alata]|uniref:Ribosomal protein L34Ae protein n=1 Tax=Dioscorea alata TaxID=55571 RepID=A0ACB7UDU6_DIOAL|nr:Ribosomal protein L34Ae protein [Dioscorea alata]